MPMQWIDDPVDLEATDYAMIFIKGEEWSDIPEGWMVHSVVDKDIKFGMYWVLIEKIIRNFEYES